MNKEGNNNGTLIAFATKIGSLEAGLKALDRKVEGHLKAHNMDRVMQWCIIALQLVVLMFVGWLKTTTM